MGIISRGRCCGRNIVFDAVTGLNPPLDSFPVFYQSQQLQYGALGSPATLHTPLGDFVFQIPTDLIDVKATYPTFAGFMSQNTLGEDRFFWYIIDTDGTLDLNGWQIDDGLTQTDLIWSNSGGETLTTVCYSKQIAVDTGTNPNAAIMFINTLYAPASPVFLWFDPVGNGTDFATVNSAFTTLMQVMFNLGVSASITDDGGGLFTVQVTGLVQWPPIPPILGIAYDAFTPSVDEEINLDVITCP